jgi:predicted nucleotidyltransferase
MSKYSPAEHAILLTLAYSSLFRFPLTEEELWKYLISEKKISSADFSAALKQLHGQILKRSGYMTLKGENANIKHRRENVRLFTSKKTIARKAATYLTYIPSILFIGISGSIAMNNPQQDDDIDLFIITKKNTLFLTRFWIQAVLEFMFLRRKRTDITAPDKICVNLLIDETQMHWPARKHDLYTAHEIIHVQPLFERNDSYSAFLSANAWAYKYFPNVTKNVAWKTIGRRKYLSLAAIQKIMEVLSFEKFLRSLQISLMRGHKTTEEVTKTKLALHPNNYRAKILANLATKSSQLGLLTNK